MTINDLSYWRCLYIVLYTILYNTAVFGVFDFNVVILCICFFLCYCFWEGSVTKQKHCQDIEFVNKQTKMN